MNARTRILNLALLIAILLAASTGLYAFIGSDGQVGPSIDNINLEQIVGTFGGEGGIDQDASDFQVSGKYGFHVNPGTCSGAAQDQGSVSNILYFKITWTQGDPVDRIVKAKGLLMDKQAAQFSADYTGPVGPPLWDVTASVKISTPTKGSEGDSNQFIDHAHHFTHTPGPGSQLNWNFSSGSEWLPEATAEMSEAFPVNPEDEGTHVFWVSTKVITTFSGNAREIEAKGDNYLRARAVLAASMHAPPP